mmetsp:Transcript_55870/g.130498  ORF Transcript_55870/g.130498 Transcript_55870/m.130498 type:complete len:294 (-) Transcript_55870:99-980(-)
MQYYPMDVVASGSTEPFDFTMDPDGHPHWNSFLNNGSNFLFYHKLGNVGFLGYSGAASYDETFPQLREACDYFEETKPEVIFLLGHWNSAGLGCSKSMSVPSIHQTLLGIPSCAKFGHRIKYMDGHEHCNYVQAHDGSTNLGFMIGAHGMADVNCAPQYGFVYLDSTQGSVNLYYFEVGRGGRWGVLAGIGLGLLLGAALGVLAGFVLTNLCTCATNRKTCTYATLGVLGMTLGVVAGFMAGIFLLNPLFPTDDHFDKIMDCVQNNGGLHACTHLASEWLRQPFSNERPQYLV